MKSAVWFELPKALCDIAITILPLSDIEYMNILTEESKVYYL